MCITKDFFLRAVIFLHLNRQSLTIMFDIDLKLLSYHHVNL